MKKFLLFGLIMVQLSLALPMPAENGETEEPTEGAFEEMPFTLEEQTEDYELRVYPAMQCVCTSVSNVDVTQDPLEGWQSNFDGPVEAISTTINQNETKAAMHRKLEAYLLGVNKGFVEFPITIPIILEWLPAEDGLTEMVLCVWPGSEWTGKELPEPAREEVFIKQAPELRVYVRRFPGWALSFSDWSTEKDTLAAALTANGANFNDTFFFSAGFSFPWEMENRRTEVWLEALEPSEEDVEETGGDGEQDPYAADAGYGTADNATDPAANDTAADPYADDITDPYAADDMAAADPYATDDMAAADPYASDDMAAADPYATDDMAAADPYATDDMAAADPYAADMAAADAEEPTEDVEEASGDEMVAADPADAAQEDAYPHPKNPSKKRKY